MVDSQNGKYVLIIQMQTSHLTPKEGRIPKALHISRSSGGLERSELGLEVRWFDGLIGWLDGWISIDSSHMYIYTWVTWVYLYIFNLMI